MKSFIALIFSLVVAWAQFTFATSPYFPLWSLQYGTSATDFPWSIAQSSSKSYFVAGATYGSLAAPNAGFDDSFANRITRDGGLDWKVQVGSSKQERYQAVATAGNEVHFLTGLEQAAASGMPGIYRYDIAGNLQSTSVSGFPNLGAEVDTATITTDLSGNVYVAGSIHQNFRPTNGFVAKMNSQGATEWHRLTNVVPQNFEKFDLAVDANGSLYVAQTTLNAAQGDVRLHKYSSQGQLLWARTYGTSLYEGLEDIALDPAGNPVLVGTTQGNFGGTQAGDGDVFALKVDSNGNTIWNTQFGDAAHQSAISVDIAPNGRIFVGGVDYNIPGQINSANQDAFWSELDSTGELQWVSEFGTSGQGDVVLDLMVDAGGDVVLVGQTSGSLYGVNRGQVDVFVVKYNVNLIPEPTAVGLFLIGCLASCCTRQRW